MTLFENILKDLNLILEDASISDINNSITNLLPAVITYDDGDGGDGKGERTIYPVAYGISTAGNPVVRAFQPQGSSKRGTPKWKLFRLDKINNWKTIPGQKYDPKSLNGFNEDGDAQIETLYTIAPIGVARSIQSKKQSYGLKSTPITKSDVKNIQTPEEPENKNSEYTANDTINSLINNVKSSKSVDNIGGISDTNNDGDILKAPETQPIKKSEIASDNDETEQVASNQEPNKEQETNTDVPNGPIMKQDIETPEGVKSDFKDMMDRMDKLNNNEEENNEEDADKQGTT